MKYILFAWIAGDRKGGWDDFIKLFDSVEQAEDYFTKHNYIYGQIVNATSLQVEKEL